MQREDRFERQKWSYFESSTGNDRDLKCLTCLHPPLSITLFLSRTTAVVMAMESVSASAPGTVAMEILPVLEEDESSPGSEERMRPRGGGSFNRERYYLLAVIGEIGSELQLDAAREHIERGERVRLSAV